MVVGCSGAAAVAVVVGACGGGCDGCGVAVLVVVVVVVGADRGGEEGAPTVMEGTATPSSPLKDKCIVL